MKKGDDFFRITFSRDVEEIRKFEMNTEIYLKQHPMHRPYLIAMICNQFYEGGFSVPMLSDNADMSNTGNGEYEQDYAAPDVNKTLNNHAPEGAEVISTYKKFDNAESGLPHESVSVINSDVSESSVNALLKNMGY